MIERKIMEVVGGGCVVPMAAHARVEKEKARVLAEILSRDGKRFVRFSYAGTRQTMDQALERMAGFLRG